MKRNTTAIINKGSNARGSTRRLLIIYTLVVSGHLVFSFRIINVIVFFNSIQLYATQAAE